MPPKKIIRYDIQALRAIAIIAVVIYHLWPNRLVGGFMGVDIFFVISGYLMTLTLVRDMAPVLKSRTKIRDTYIFLSNFYARRIKRLIPAATVALVGTLGLVIATGQLNLIQKTAEQIAASALFVQNLFLANTSVDYLNASEPPTAVQHFWSLSLEEQFYLVWPLLLLSISLVTARLLITYSGKKISSTVIPVALLAVVFFIYGYITTKTDPSQAYFITPARVWELIIGGMLVFLPTIKNYDLRLLLPWLGTVVCMYGLYKIGGENFPGWHALIPVIGTALIIYGGTDNTGSNLSFGNALKAKPIQWIGNISYSLYLWHWPLIVLLPTLLLVDIEGEYSETIKVGILILSFVIAWLSYRFVEQSTLRIPIKKSYTYLGFVIVVTAVACSALYTAHSAKTSAVDGLATLHATALNEKKACFGARSIISDNNCTDTFGAVNQNWLQFVKADASLAIIGDDIWCDYYRIGEQDDFTKYCEYGDTGSDRTIAVWGDSHSDHWVNALHQIGLRRNIKFIQLSSGSCGVQDVSTLACQDRLNFIKERGLVKDADAVILSVWMNGEVDRAQKPLKVLKEITEAPVYLMQDVPEASAQGGPECITKRQTCTNSRGAALADVTSTINQLIEKGSIRPSEVIPTEDLFCDKDICYSFIGGVSVYRDTDATGNAHMSSVYSLSLSALLERKLNSINAL